MKGHALMKKQMMNIIFFISLNVMSTLFAFRYGPLLMSIHLIVSFFSAYWMIFKKHFLEKSVLKIQNNLMNYICCIASVSIGIIHIKSFYKNLFVMFQKLETFLKLSANLQELLAIIISILFFVSSFFAIFIIMLAFFDKISDFIKKEQIRICEDEKIYLRIVCICLGIFVIILFNCTNIFYFPKQNNELIKYDVIYTMNTGELFNENAWLNISASQNDIRQPLFAVFAIPFAVICFIISKILFFIPNCYAVLLTLLQALLISYSYVLISRLMKLEGKERRLFLALCTFTYPFLLFALNMEQYVFSTFWMIMFIYSALTDRENINYLYIAATGSMLTSGIFFYFLSESKKLKQWIRDVIKVSIDFFVVTIYAGQFIFFVLLIPSMKSLLRFSGAEISISDKILQFFNFVATCLIAPETMIANNMYNCVSLQLAPVRTINILGIVVLIIVILGYIYNKKDKLAQVCMIWVIFSFVILCLLGWGTKENGLVLYTLYFSWAYIVLSVMFLKKILKKEKMRSFVYIALIGILILKNLSAMVELVKFGIEYYPIV